MTFIEGLFAFTNIGHFVYFLVSLSGLFLMLIASNRKRIAWAGGASLGHLIQIGIAAIVVMLDIDVNDVWTADCIWFNALIAALHAIIFVRAIKVDIAERRADKTKTDVD